MARTQAQRREETRARLLEAAARLFAAHGVEGASVDAIADAAGRTSGSVYAHFGSKDGLLTALVDSWKNDVAASITAEVSTASTLEERLAALWRNIVDPPTGDGHWVQLEHELWLYASRHPSVREQLASRYREAGAAMAGAIGDWLHADGDHEAARPGAGALLIGLLLGLEMQRRIAPDAVPDDLAVAGLRALLEATTTRSTT